MGMLVIVASGLGAILCTGALALALRRRRRFDEAGDKSAAFLARNQIGVTRMGASDGTFARAARPWEQQAPPAPSWESTAPAPAPAGGASGTQPNSGALNRAQAAMRV